MCLSREVEEPLFFEPPLRGLPGVEKGALMEIAKGVLGLPDSLQGWCKELRDTLQGDSWKSLKVDPAFSCLRDFSGHLINVPVDDMLLANDNSHQAESHISRLICKYDIKDVKRADDDGGVLYCGKRVRTVPDDTKPAGLALRQDETEFVVVRCEPAIVSRVRARQEGAQCTTSETREMRSMTGSLQWVMGGTRPDESFATSQLQRKQSAPLVSDHKRAVQTIKCLRSQPEIGLRFRPLPTKMCVLVYTNSALHNADANTNEEGSSDEWLAKAKQKGIRVRSQHGALVCVVAQDDLEKTDDLEKQSFKTNNSVHLWAEASACRDALDLAEYTRAIDWRKNFAARMFLRSTCPSG